MNSAYSYVTHFLYRRPNLLAWVVLLLALALLVEDATQVCWGQAGDPVSSLCTPCGVDLFIFIYQRPISLNQYYFSDNSMNCIRQVAACMHSKNWQRLNHSTCGALQCLPISPISCCPLNSKFWEASWWFLQRKYGHFRLTKQDSCGRVSWWRPPPFVHHNLQLLISNTWIVHDSIEDM